MPSAKKPNRSFRDIAAIKAKLDVVSKEGGRYGLVIGVNAYRDQGLNLRCARQDAEEMYAIMTDPLCGLFDAGHVVKLYDKDATKERIMGSLNRLAQETGPSSSVWIYFAGHAAVDGNETYWIAHDTHLPEIRTTGIPDNEIARLLNYVKSRQVLVFMDCCHATAMNLLPAEDGHRIAVPEPKVAERLLKNLNSGEGRIRISSCGREEHSAEDLSLGHGVFTSVLVEGLRGKADAEWSGFVTLENLSAYLGRELPRRLQDIGHFQIPRVSGQHAPNLRLTVNREWLEFIRERNVLMKRIKQEVELTAESPLSIDEARALTQIVVTPPPQRTQVDVEVVERVKEWSRARKKTTQDILLQDLKRKAQVAMERPLRPGREKTDDDLDDIEIPVEDESNPDTQPPTEDQHEPGSGKEDIPLKLPPEDRPVEAVSVPSWRDVLNHLGNGEPVRGKIAIVGARAHGKSWYLWSLNELLQRHRFAGWRFDSRGEAFSDLVSSIDSAIKNRQPVAPTDMAREAKEFELFRATRFGISYSVRICDPAGEHMRYAFSMSRDKVREIALNNFTSAEREVFLEAVKMFMENICTSEAMLLLVDARSLLFGDANWKREWLLGVTNMLDMLAERDKRQWSVQDGRILTPVAIVFTKIETFLVENMEEEEDEGRNLLAAVLLEETGRWKGSTSSERIHQAVKSLLRSAWPDFLDYLNRRLANHKFFAVSAWGGDENTASRQIPGDLEDGEGYTVPPPDIAPFLTEQPLLWALDELWLEDAVQEVLADRKLNVGNLSRAFPELYHLLAIGAARRFPALFIRQWRDMDKDVRGRLLEALNCASGNVAPAAKKELLQRVLHRGWRALRVFARASLVLIVALEVLFWGTYGFAKASVKYGNRSGGGSLARRYLRWQPVPRWAPWNFERNAVETLFDQEATTAHVAFLRSSLKMSEEHALGHTAKTKQFGLEALGLEQALLGAFSPSSEARLRAVNEFSRAWTAMVADATEQKQMALAEHLASTVKLVWKGTTGLDSVESLAKIQEVFINLPRLNSIDFRPEIKVRASMHLQAVLREWGQRQTPTELEAVFERHSQLRKIVDSAGCVRGSAWWDSLTGEMLDVIGRAGLARESSAVAIAERISENMVPYPSRASVVDLLILAGDRSAIAGDSRKAVAFWERVPAGRARSVQDRLLVTKSHLHAQNRVESLLAGKKYADALVAVTEYKKELPSVLRNLDNAGLQTAFRKEVVELETKVRQYVLLEHLVEIQEAFRDAQYDSTRRQILSDYERVVRASLREAEPGYSRDRIWTNIAEPTGRNLRNFSSTPASINPMIDEVLQSISRDMRTNSL
ncbi:MAG: caspase family protein [Kiritimatiellae bacterium]|nr:caspase family protein [Kiritimatiellia bacterium]